eukprot:CAMPEP_0201988440 /NCGR_PEP_ID=MMETSP0904-20121228/92331_1 /ASSEMBLY_ACC=CAM_ASM_000553 /TAXON_ID=420261 /ORGANISM="Thalassiosira antarctica, Strain CCMP982" /LENGTH=113 /DNA_ID=CAMNT_0048542613 /DNA_START=666 /DNA_END=1003 /DNA_ORIENTATION=-
MIVVCEVGCVSMFVIDLVRVMIPDVGCMASACSTLVGDAIHTHNPSCPALIPSVGYIASACSTFAGDAIHTHNPSCPNGTSRDSGIDGWRLGIQHHELFRRGTTGSSSVGATV